MMSDSSNETIFEWTELSKLSRNIPIANELLHHLKGKLFPELEGQLFGPDIHSSTTIDSIVKTLTICRNCCGHIDSIMPMFLAENGIPGKIFKFCRKISILDKVEQSFAKGNDDEGEFQSPTTELDSAEKERIVSIIMQLFANFTAASIDGCDYLVFNHKQQLSDLLAAALATGNRKTISAAISIVFNCLCSAKRGFQQRCDMLLSERLLFCQLFLSLYPQNTTSSSQTINSHDIPENDVVAEWLSLLVSEIVSQGKDLSMHRLLGSTQGNIFTLEQLTFLYIMSSLDEISSEQQDFLATESTLFYAIVSQLQQLLPKLKENTLAQKNGNLSNFDMLNHGQYFDYGLVAMDYLSKVLCHHPDVQEVREVLAVEYNIVKDLCGYLEFHQENKCDQADIINALLQFMSNLIYRCSIAQDHFLENKGVAIVLGMCGTNINQPLRREWSLMCIRNACETNERIRQFIESLQLQDTVVVNEKLKDSGIQVEIDSKTGKLKFVPPK